MAIVDTDDLCRKAGFCSCTDEEKYKQQDKYIQEICNRLEVSVEDEEWGLFQRPLPPEGIELFYIPNNLDNVLYFCFPNKKRVELEAKKLEGMELAIGIGYDRTGKVPLFGEQTKVSKPGNINLTKISPDKKGQEALDILLAYAEN